MRTPSSTWPLAKVPYTSELLTSLGRADSGMSKKESNWGSQVSVWRERHSVRDALV